MDFLQNLFYGRYEEILDLYLLEIRKGNNNIFVVIFVFGGVWFMKNKEMYGFLCSEMVNKF